MAVIDIVSEVTGTILKIVAQVGQRLAEAETVQEGAVVARLQQGGR